MPVLTAIDAEEGSEAIVSAGAELATDLGRELIVCHVIPDADEQDAARGEVEGIVRRAIGDAEAATISIRAGPETAYQLLEEARDVGAEYIVVGTGRHTPIGQVLLGSVAQLIVLNADVPVVNVPLPE